MNSLLSGEEGTLLVPVPSYLIDHPKGAILFDTGLHRDIFTDKAGYLGKMAKWLDVTFHPGEDITARLGVMEHDAGKIETVVISHLHFDHCGGNAQLPNARMIVQAREWAAGHEPDFIRTNGYKTEDYDLGHDILQIEGEHDVFGDNSVVCIPTYGHTPGHQSLIVRTDGGEVVLAGDACYLRRTLEKMWLPRQVHDKEAMLASLKILAGLKARGARIFYGHDPEFWKDVPQAPAAIA
ncbi:MAG: N-acyl homoserine lactonase family protein [Alphaproteobacteria bacterium]|nr:N-acyl homoserine lactonase family protein [Alphaproteobacteria bacterium]